MLQDLSLLVDTLLGSHKMVPPCHHLTGRRRVSVVGNFLLSHFKSTSLRLHQIFS